jgi:hypothetical protein
MEAVAAAIVAFVKAIPAIDRIYQRSVALYYAAEEARDHDHMSEIEQERDMLLATIQQPGITDAQKRVARKRLIALSAH